MPEGLGKAAFLSDCAETRLHLPLNLPQWCQYDPWYCE